MPKTAVFIIDIQRGLAGKEHANTIPHSARIRSAATEILVRARHANKEAEKEGSERPLELVFVQHEELDGPADEPLIRGKEGWKLVFEPDESWMGKGERLVHKTDGDTFQSNPKLADELKALGVSQVVNFGIQSDACVALTSEGALKNGLKVKLLSGAHSTYDDAERGMSALEVEREVEGILKGKGVEVIPWEEWEP